MQFRRTEGRLDCLLDGRRRAVIEKRAGMARPWLLWRIQFNRDGSETEFANEAFRSLAAAQDRAREIFR